MKIKSIPDALSPDAYRNFCNELSESNLILRQEYKCRLMTGSEHHEWLRSRFQHIIDTVVMQQRLSGEVQQVFYSVELPGCDFMIHRAHANIGCVISYDLEDFGGVAMREWLEGFDEQEDYQWRKDKYPFAEHEFKVNQALVIPNHEPRFHWGYNAPIGQGRAKQTVWIYLGK